MKTACTITIESISALADQLAADLAKVREILDAATAGDITPAQAADKLRQVGIAIM